MESTRNEDPRSRPTAAELLDRLDAVVSGIPPALLRKKPVELPEEPYSMSDSQYRRLEASGKRLEAERKAEAEIGVLDEAEAEVGGGKWPDDAKKVASRETTST